MKYWISKYALSKGIFEVDGIPTKNKMISTGTGLFQSYYHEGDYHETEAQARIDAEAQRLKKIASLRKQILKLEKKSFL